MDPYQILGVTRDYSKDDIRAAYLRLVREYHPDRNGGSKVHEERLKRVNVAYDLICNGTLEVKAKNTRKPFEGRTYMCNVTFRENLFGKIVNIEGILDSLSPGWTNSSGVLNNSGATLNTILNLPEGFTYKNGCLRRTVVIQKRFCKKGKVINIPMPNSYGGIVDTEWTLPQTFTDELNWQFFKVGLMKKDMVTRGDYILTIKAGKNQKLFGSIFS